MIAYFCSHYRHLDDYWRSSCSELLIIVGTVLLQRIITVDLKTSSLSVGHAGRTCDQVTAAVTAGCDPYKTGHARRFCGNIANSTSRKGMFVRALNFPELLLLTFSRDLQSNMSPAARYRRIKAGRTEPEIPKSRSPGTQFRLVPTHFDHCHPVHV